MLAMHALTHRHDADAAMIADMATTAFDGARYDAFITQLFRYAWPVMLNKIRTGDIAAIKTRLPHGSISPDEQRVLHDSAPDREELALACTAPKPVACCLTCRFVELFTLLCSTR